MKKSFIKAFSLLTFMLFILLLSACGTAPAENAVVSVDAASLVASAIRASREAGSASEQDSLQENNNPFDGNHLIESQEPQFYDSLFVEIDVSVKLTDERGRTIGFNSDTISIPFSKFEQNDDIERLEDIEDFVSFFEIKKSTLTFNKIRVGSSVKAQVELNSSIKINNITTLKQELRDYMEEKLSKTFTDTEFDKFFENYVSEIVKGGMHFGLFKGTGVSEPKNIEAGNNNIDVTLKLEEIEFTLPYDPVNPVDPVNPINPVNPDLSVTLNFLFNDGNGKYTAKEEYPEIKISIDPENPDNFSQAFYEVFKRISLAGYSLNEDKSDYLPDELEDITEDMTVTLYFDEMSSVELLGSIIGVSADDKTPQGTYELDIYDNFAYQVSYKVNEASDPVIVSKGKWFYTDADIGKESDTVEIIEYEYYDSATQTLKKLESPAVLGVFDETGLYYVLTSTAGYTIKFIFDYNGGSGDEIPITVNIKNLPAEAEDFKLLNVCTLLVNEDAYDDMVSMFNNTTDTDAQKIIQLVDLLYTDSVCHSIGRYSQGYGVDVIQQNNGLEATVDAVYYVDKIFNKDIGDDVGVLTLIYYGKDSGFYTTPYIGYSSSTITLDEDSNEVEISAWDSDYFPARISLYANDEKAMKDSEQIYFDYAIPKGYKTSSYDENQFMSDLLNQNVLQSYIQAGYVFDRLHGTIFSGCGVDLYDLYLVKEETSTNSGFDITLPDPDTFDLSQSFQLKCTENTSTHMLTLALSPKDGLDASDILSLTRNFTYQWSIDGDVIQNADSGTKTLDLSDYPALTPNSIHYVTVAVTYNSRVYTMTKKFQLADKE